MPEAGSFPSTKRLCGGGGPSDRRCEALRTSGLPPSHLSFSQRRCSACRSSIGITIFVAGCVITAHGKISFWTPSGLVFRFAGPVGPLKVCIGEDDTYQTPRTLAIQLFLRWPSRHWGQTWRARTCKHFLWPRRAGSHLTTRPEQRSQGFQTVTVAV